MKKSFETPEFSVDMFASEEDILTNSGDSTIDGNDNIGSKDPFGHMGG